jgi:hypothetical protein
MKKILLLQNEKYLDSQVVKPVNYANIMEEWLNQGGGNSGNKLFTTSIEKALYRPDINVSYITSEMTAERINKEFDMVVFPTANIFGEHYVHGLEDYAYFFEELRIPVYVIGAGIQCKSAGQINELADKIGIPARKFVEAVYHTKGELALRGHYTKAFLDKVVENSAVVTGCPSLYQNGRNLKICHEKVEFEKFRVAINGSVKSLNQTNLRKMVKMCTYMDQDEFIAGLFDRETFHAMSAVKKMWKYSNVGLEMLASGNVQLIYDIPVWMQFMKDNFDFSVGTRIHGNIAAILSGVPAVVVYQDLRTRELAEFFDIPAVDHLECKNKEELYDMYLLQDYETFNSKFEEKYDAFERFLVKHGIVDSLDVNSEWAVRERNYDWKMPQYCLENMLDAQGICRKYPKILRNCFSGPIYAKLKNLKKYSVTFTHIR